MIFPLHNLDEIYVSLANMLESDLQEFYEMVAIGTKISIR